MTVKDIIDKLNTYSSDSEVLDINSIYMSETGKICLVHEDTEEEKYKAELQQKEWDLKHNTRRESQGEVSSFANRW